MIQGIEERSPRSEISRVIEEYQTDTTRKHGHTDRHTQTKKHNQSSHTLNISTDVQMQIRKTLSALRVTFVQLILTNTVRPVFRFTRRCFYHLTVNNTFSWRKQMLLWHQKKCKIPGEYKIMSQYLKWAKTLFCLWKLLWPDLSLMLWKNDL